MENKVTKEEMKALPKILAVDFDGTLVTDCYPAIGVIRNKLWKKVLKYRKKGWKLILWTCRDGEQLHAAIAFCYVNGLEFDSHNKNIVEVREMFNNDTRKVYATKYLDDKSIEC